MENTILEVNFKHPVCLNACSAMASQNVSIYQQENDGLFGYIGTNTGEVGGFISESAVLNELRELGAQIRHICRLV